MSFIFEEKKKLLLVSRKLVFFYGTLKSQNVLLVEYGHYINLKIRRFICKYIHFDRQNEPFSFGGWRALHSQLCGSTNIVLMRDSPLCIQSSRGSCLSGWTTFSSKFSLGPLTGRGRGDRKWHNGHSDRLAVSHQEKSRDVTLLYEAMSSLFWLLCTLKMTYRLRQKKYNII